MSTMVQMPVRVKPPPAETGETISPGCASFDSATPLNGARMTVSSIAVCCIAIWLSATLTCSCAEAMRATSESTSAFALSMSFGVFRPSLRSCSCRCSWTRACVEPHFAFGNLPLRRFELRAIQPQRRLQGGVVQPGEHLAFADRHAFLDVDLDHLAGDLRRHRGAAARRDVARGVEHRGLRAGGTLGDGRDFDFNRPLAREPIPGAAAGAAEQHEQDRPISPIARRPC